MSWLSDLAKGAEALLEKVDQSTASALQNERHSPETSSYAALSETNQDGTLTIAPVTNDQYQTASIQSLPARTSVPVTKSIQRPVSTSRKKTDEQLFEFLNSGPSSLATAEKRAPQFTSTPVKQKSSQNAQQPDDQTGVVFKSEKTMSTDKEGPASQEVEKVDNTEIPSLSLENVAIPDEIDGTVKPKTEVKSTENELKKRDDRVSNLQLENRLLKGEITSLNEELASAMKRLKEAEEGAKHLELKLEHAQNQMMQQDRIVRGVEEKERDLSEALKAKDSQLAVLRVRMQEADDELNSKTELLRNLTAENERILKDHTDSTGLQSVALDSFKVKLEEKEKELKNIQAEFNRAQSEIMDLRGKLQNEQLQMADSVKTLQLKLSDEKAKVKDLDHNLRMAKDSADTAQRDFKEYKDKATRILQAKEKLINSLKQGTVGSEASPIMFTELEEVKQERDLLREELQQSKYKLEQLKVELFEAEQQSQTEIEEQQQAAENLEKSLEEEKNRRQHLEEELLRSSQELTLLKEDLTRQKSKTAAVLQERDTEIQRLNHQISLKSSLSPSQEELENRVHAITDNLIQKQTIIERLSTEKNSLSLQLERLEQQYRDVQQHLSNSNIHMRHSHFDIEDSEEGNSNSLASIMPAGVVRSKRWKSTVNVIDKFSIRLGVFLRRYPIARLFVILYMFVLHLWVTIVLLTYQPEIHTKNSNLPGRRR